MSIEIHTIAIVPTWILVLSIFYLMNIYYKISLQIKPPEINILSLMPDEKKIFGGLLVLDFRK